MAVFGPLFYATDNVFEALAGTLKTAKKYGVVEYDGDLLMQGAHDSTEITLLKETHDGAADAQTPTLIAAGVEVKKRKKLAAVGGRPPSTSGFGAASKQHTQSKCAVCSKTVYPMEYVGVADLVRPHRMHHPTDACACRHSTRRASAATRAATCSSRRTVCRVQRALRCGNIARRLQH